MPSLDLVSVLVWEASLAILAAMAMYCAVLQQVGGHESASNLSPEIAVFFLKAAPSGTLCHHLCWCESYCGKPGQPCTWDWLVFTSAGLIFKGPRDSCKHASGYSDHCHFKRPSRLHATTTWETTAQQLSCPCAQVVESLSRLAADSVVHFDIKSANVLVRAWGWFCVPFSSSGKTDFC